MAWVADQKSDRLSIGTGHRAAQYFVNAWPGLTAAAAGLTVITLTAQFAFKGNGQIDVSLPHDMSLAAGLVLGQAQLLGPASGSYSAGNHPRITVQVQNTIGITTTAVADLIVVQY
jgi:hypothetical protein